MASPITWRGVQAASQRDALLGRAQALQGINKGFGGLQNTIGGIADDQRQAIADQEQDALNSILNRISGINSVEGINQARQNQLVGNSGLNAEAQMQARSALESRLNSLYDSDQKADAFASRELQQAERPILNQISKLEAEGKFDEALAQAQNLSNPGEIISRLTQGRNAANKKTSLSDAQEDLYFNLNGINRARGSNEDVSRQILSENSYLSDGLEIGKNGQLKFKPNLTDEQKQQYSLVLNEAQQKYVQPSNYQDLSQDILRRAFEDPNINIGDVQNLLGTVGTVQELDPVVQEQRQREAIEQRLAESNINTEKEVLGARQKAFNEANPVDPTLTRRTVGSNQEAIDQFQELAMSNNAFSDIGEGDFAAFNNEVNKVVKELGKEGVNFSPEALSLALDEMPQVIEAKQEGNLGDWGDNIDRRTLKAKILEKQRLIDNDQAIRNSRTQNEINTLRGQSALEQELIKRLGGG